MNSIEVEGLTRKFGGLTAVDNVSFEVSEGEVFGFLGPNGAGKTTLIRMLTTLIKPTSGRARVAGVDILKDPDAVRLSIGVVPQAMTSDLDLTGKENMEIYGRFYDMSGREIKERAGVLLELVGLSQRGNDLVATYSGGMRRRLEVVKALIHKPKILFLDEPTIGLDPQSRRTIWAFLEEFNRAENLTIFLTTHYMEEAETLSRRVGIIDYGRLIALDTPEALKSRLPEKDTVLLELQTASDELAKGLERLDFVYGVKRQENTVRVYVEKGGQVIARLLQRVAELGGVVNSVSIKERTLEDVFIHYTGRAIREEEAKKVSFLVGAGAPRKMPGR